MARLFFLFRAVCLSSRKIKIEILLTILGWLAWCVAAYLAITFVYGNRLYAKSGIPLNYITCVQTFLWWGIALTFLFSNLSKLHIIWLVPISYFGARFIVLTGLPPILAQIILIFTQIFMQIILLGVRVPAGVRVENKKRIEMNPKDERLPRSFTDIIEQQLQDVITYNSQGNSHVHRGEYDCAISDFTRAVEADPGYPETHYNLGYTYLRKGNMDLALRELEILETLDEELTGKLRRKLEQDQVIFDKIAGRPS
jgi:tetratricopeptide (TPR) repeat protein